jgi:hypothetical protein
MGWNTSNEREYEVMFSTIAYVAVKVKAVSLAHARQIAKYTIAGRGPNGEWIPGRRATLCAECQKRGVTLSDDALVIDYVNEPNESQLQLGEDMDEIKSDQSCK